MSKIIFPLDNYKVSGYKFGQVVPGWGTHLGDDCDAKENTPVKSIVTGVVVYSALHPGSVRKRNWGNIIIIKHKVFRKRQFYYSLYAHLGKRLKKINDKIKKGEVVGYIGKSNCAENGWWPAHLHFAIYTGPWNDQVLPGYYKKEQKRTRLSYWKNPTEWISENSK
jgi:murein DD-endopeptidase MepM/ murein hydrolase activator NlpD